MFVEKNKFDIKWNYKYNLAKKYYEKYNDLQVSQNFRTVNGTDYDENGAMLGNWVDRQRVLYKKGMLDNDKKDKLEKIGIKNSIQLSWEEVYALAQNYFRKNGNSEISKSFRTINGMDYDENGIMLGNWISNQRKLYKKGLLLPDRFEKLKNIKLRFDIKKISMSWDECYNLVLNYYKKYGNTNMNKEFKTLDGLKYDANGLNLRYWIDNQRQKYKRDELTSVQISKLKLIKISFENMTFSWDKSYSIAKKYYEYYGNLDVHINFKTLDCINYDEKGIDLRNWVNKQRSYYNNGSLSDEKISLLNDIGMIWNREDNKNKLEKLCKYYNINYKKYKNLLDSFMADELFAKLKYLTKNNIDIVNKDGILNNILFMSKISLQTQYAIDINEVIDNTFKSKIK